MGHGPAERRQMLLLLLVQEALAQACHVRLDPDVGDDPSGPGMPRGIDRSRAPTVGTCPEGAVRPSVCGLPRASRLDWVFPPGPNPR
jgi:hypothetical protein